jgi:hypothetical protein
VEFVLRVRHDDPELVRDVEELVRHEKASK